MNARKLTYLTSMTLITITGFLTMLSCATAGSTTQSSGTQSGGWDPLGDMADSVTQRVDKTLDGVRDVLSGAKRTADDIEHIKNTTKDLPVILIEGGDPESSGTTSPTGTTPPSSETQTATGDDYLSSDQLAERLAKWWENKVERPDIVALVEPVAAQWNSRLAELELSPLQRVVADFAFASPRDTSPHILGALIAMDEELARMFVLRVIHQRNLHDPNPSSDRTALPREYLSYLLRSRQYEILDDLFREMLGPVTIHKNSSNNHIERNARTPELTAAYIILATTPEKYESFVEYVHENFAGREYFNFLDVLARMYRDTVHQPVMPLISRLVGDGVARYGGDSLFSAPSSSTPGITRVCIDLLQAGASPEDVRALGQFAPRLQQQTAMGSIDQAVKEHSFQQRGALAAYDIDGRDLVALSFEALVMQLLATGTLEDANRVWAEFMHAYESIAKSRARPIWKRDDAKLLAFWDGKFNSARQGARQLRTQDQMIAVARHLKALGADETAITTALKPFLPLVETNAAGSQMGTAVAMAIILASIGETESARSMLDAGYPTIVDAVQARCAVPQIIRAELLAGRLEAARELLLELQNVGLHDRYTLRETAFDLMQCHLTVTSFGQETLLNGFADLVSTESLRGTHGGGVAERVRIEAGMDSDGFGFSPPTTARPITNVERLHPLRLAEAKLQGEASSGSIEPVRVRETFYHGSDGQVHRLVQHDEPIQTIDLRSPLEQIIGPILVTHASAPTDRERHIILELALHPRGERDPIGIFRSLANFILKRPELRDAYARTSGSRLGEVKFDYIAIKSTEARTDVIKILDAALDAKRRRVQGQANAPVWEITE